MQRKHRITPEVANDALSDADRVLIVPDYNGTSGQSARIIGYSVMADDVITIIVLEHDGITHGVNGWSANAKDRGIYSDETDDAEEGESDDQGD